MVKQLTAKQVEELKGFKGTPCGRDKFFDMIEDIYKDDAETLAEIEKCKEMHESLAWIETYPAYEKTQNMFYEFMDALLKKIGYTI